MSANAAKAQAPAFMSDDVAEWPGIPASVRDRFLAFRDMVRDPKHRRRFEDAFQCTSNAWISIYGADRLA